MSRQLSRRRFLGASLAGGAALSVGSWVRTARALSESLGNRHLHARAFLSMNTIVEIVAVGRDVAKLPAACEAARAACAEVEARMNFFDPRSELSALNATPVGCWREVSAELFEVLAMASRVHEDSAGAFDPGVGALVNLYRKAKAQQRLPATQELGAAHSDGFAAVELDESGRRVRFTSPGVLIDLSGIAKGYAVDRAVAAMRDAGARSGIVNAGGDLFVFGTDRLPAAEIEDPYRPGETRRRLEIVEQALATSGDAEQGVILEGRPLSHLIDPSTGESVRASVGSASVRAENAVFADAWASALYVRPSLAGRVPVESLLIVPETEHASAGFFPKPTTSR